MESPLREIQLGANGPTVSAVGLGCMGLSFAYGEVDEAQAINVIQQALDSGINYLDSADIYGDNHQRIAKAIKGRRDQAFIATKCGFVISPDNVSINGSPDYIRNACDSALQELDLDTIDLFYLHRADKQVPIEESVGAMADLAQEGKIRYLGLSEVSPETLMKAHATHPIHALQSEYSLWHREPEHKIFETCQHIGCGFVAFSPLGRGFLAGYQPTLSNALDFRTKLPRFQTDNLRNNLWIQQVINDFAATHQCTPAQLALAWILHQPHPVLPIPGTSSLQHLKENIAALQVELSDEEWESIGSQLLPDAVKGEQFPAHLNFYQ